MKNFLLVLAITGISLEAFSQIENVKISDELKFEKVYAGFDTKMIVPNDSLIANANASIRLGTALNLSLSEKVSIYAHGALQLSSAQEPFAITAFIVNIQLTTKLKLEVGLPPTATTFTRPHPITWQNQTESYAQSRIPGNKPGALLQYSLTDKLKLFYSFQNLDGQTWSNHLNITYGKFSIAGFVQEGNEAFVSMRLNNETIDANYNYSSLQKEHASSIFLNLTKKFTLFGDANYSSNSQKMEVSTLGIRRYFESKSYYTGGFLSAYHDIANRQTVFQLFLHLK